MALVDTLRQKAVNSSLRLKTVISDIQQCRGPRDELDELNKIGRQTITEIQSYIDKFKTLASEETRVDVKNGLNLEVKSLADDLSSTIGLFKKATLACMMNIETSDRQHLLGRDDDTLSKHRKKKSKEELVNMSSNVTDRLLSISRTLADTTQRSADTLGNLATSSGVVDSTREELDAQGNVISQSGKLLAKYGRREQTDKFLILFAAAFFFACVAYVLQKRLF